MNAAVYVMAYLFTLRM